MRQTDIPEYVWDFALVVNGEIHHHRKDLICTHLKSIKNPDGALKFDYLAQVALLVLTLPHSVEQERVFSMITKNKTKFRPNLKLDGTLSSILTVKLAITEPCHKYESPKEVLETAKKQHQSTVKHINKLYHCMYDLLYISH